MQVIPINTSKEYSDQEFIMNLTSKGQTTIPSLIRNFLGLKPEGKVSFRLDKGRVLVEPAKSALAELRGSVKPISRKLTNKQIRKIAFEDHLVNEAK